MKKLLIPISKGFEEIELVSIVDILRRCEIFVRIASLESTLEVIGAHDITLKADMMFNKEDSLTFDAIALAGGYENTQRMKTHNNLGEILHSFQNSHKLIAAICASPIVLAHFGILRSSFTCYPGCEQEALASTQNTILFTNEIVHFKDSILTSQAPASAMEFALRIADILYSEVSISYEADKDLQHIVVKQVAQNLKGGLAP